MFVELHILQNFAPSNLNRSDTGSPKDCYFGDVRRARVSSQCFKRAMRDFFRDSDALTGAQQGQLAVRTKRLLGEVAGRLVAAGKDEDEARRVVETALNGVKLTVKDHEKTQYLLFLGRDEMQAIADLCAAHYDVLLTSAPQSADDTADAKDAKKAKVSAKDAKKAAKDAVPKEVRAAFERALADVKQGTKAADLALFGRMLADLPHKNIDAAAQVAHALSTHKVGVEFDFYTAVDDIRPEDTGGADMLGTVEFNSACFYRYANIDVTQLRRNLGADEELALATVEAFIRAAVQAIPTGKQNSMAAQNPPSFVLAVVRQAGLWSLANAFVEPVRPKPDLVAASVAALDKYWGRLVQAYGSSQLAAKCYFNLSDQPAATLNGAEVNSLDDVVACVQAALGGA